MLMVRACVAGVPSDLKVAALSEWGKGGVVVVGTMLMSNGEHGRWMC